jgi:hypothetical protein
MRGDLAKMLKKLQIFLAFEGDLWYTKMEYFYSFVSNGEAVLLPVVCPAKMGVCPFHPT